MITVFAVIYCEFQKFEFFPEKGTDPPQTHHLDPRMIYLQYMGLPLIQTLYILDTKVKKTVGYYVK